MKPVSYAINMIKNTTYRCVAATTKAATVSGDGGGGEDMTGCAKLNGQPWKA